MNKKKIIITGARGLIGHYLSRALENHSHYEAIPIASQANTTDHLMPFHLFQATEEQMKRLILESEAQYIVHLAALSNVDECEKNPSLCHEMNVETTRRLAKAAHSAKAQLIFASTNAVYDGEKGNYSETDSVNPLHAYGRSKVEAENIIQDLSDNHLIFRFILAFGWNPPGSRDNPVTQLLHLYQSGRREFQMVDDVYANTLYAKDAAQAVIQAINRNLQNDIFNIAGKTRQSRHELAVSIAEVFSLTDAKIIPVPSSFFPSLTPRPRDTSFDCSKAKKQFEYSPNEIHTTLRKMKHQLLSK